MIQKARWPVWQGVRPTAHDFELDTLVTIVTVHLSYVAVIMGVEHGCDNGLCYG